MSWLRPRPRVRQRSDPARLALECLEAREVPAATLLVVPLSAPTDATHFHDLTTALGASAANDTIQIEPNSVPGGATSTRR